MKNIERELWQITRLLEQNQTLLFIILGLFLVGASYGYYFYCMKYGSPLRKRKVRQAMEDNQLTRVRKNKTVYPSFSYGIKREKLFVKRVGVHLKIINTPRNTLISVINGLEGAFGMELEEQPATCKGDNYYFHRRNFF